MDPLLGIFVIFGVVLLYAAYKHAIFSIYWKTHCSLKEKRVNLITVYSFNGDDMKIYGMYQAHRKIMLSEDKTRCFFYDAVTRLPSEVLGDYITVRPLYDESIDILQDMS